MDVGEVQFRVGYLPEQEVRDSFLAAGSDDEVGVGQIGSVHLARYLRRVYRFKREIPASVLCCDLAHRVHDLLPASVCQAHREQEVGMASGPALSPVNGLSHP